MDFCKTGAITLKRDDYSNTSQIVAFYTRDYGRIGALARGSKRMGKKPKGAIDLLCYSEIIFLKRDIAGLHILTEWEVIEDFPAFRRDLDRFYAACYVVELVEALTEEGESNEPLFRLILDTLYSLSGDGGDISLSLLTFELQMLKLLGYLPGLFECASCRARFQRGSNGLFSQAQRGLLCSRCAGEGSYVHLSPPALSVARFLAGSRLSTLGRLELSPDVSGGLRRFTQECLSLALPRPLETWKYIR